MEEVSGKLAYMEFCTRESEEYHSPVEKEMDFFESIKNGDLEYVKSKYSPLGSKGFGKLSDDRIRNLRYHFVVTVAMATRYCVDGGMEKETAYNLSDLYIQRADKLNNESDLVKLHKEVILDFTRRMAALKKQNVYSKPVVQCYDYIYNNLNRPFTVAQMAESINLSPQYLSKLFHEETGRTISEYIVSKRIETACQMLKYSDYTPSEIASFLAFSSQSHFTECFRKRMGLTPKKYRDKYFNSGLFKEKRE